MTAPAEDLTKLSREEIEARIAAVHEEMEDLGYERSMTLGGTGVHIGAVEAQRLRDEFEKDEARLTAKLQALRDLL
ncbi:MAG: hypothetical protein M5U22_11270 [Thermoleophilia bacterium]|nr:hypothetical protein [Thermoleophilia bacterium]